MKRHASGDFWGNEPEIIPREKIITELRVREDLVGHGKRERDEEDFKNLLLNTGKVDSDLERKNI